MKIVNEDIICAGYGGQGIMLMGKLLAYTAMDQGYNVTWMPSYGAEVRGGTAHSMIRIKTKTKVANPKINHATICVVLSQQSLAKFTPRLVKGGIVIADSSNIKEIPDKISGISIYKAQFTKIAEQLGDKRMANMIALGFLCRVREIFNIAELAASLDHVFPDKPAVCRINKQALEAGYAIDVR